jgi:glycosyltransferase involved in cell wall biosynthesis
MARITHSFIIPVYNEEENIKTLFEEIKRVAQKITKSFEIIFVDDGSTDNTVAQLKKLRPVRILRLRKNYGQSAALDAGIKSAKGSTIITLDGDGQNDPKDAVAMLKELNKGYDVICGWRKKRKDSFSKRFISKGAAFLRSFLVNDGVHDAGCTLRVFKRDCFDDTTLYGEMHRMIPALLRWQGFRIGEIVVHHRARRYGTTKYNWRRIFKGLIDMFAIWFWRKYENRPLYFFGILGLLCMISGVALAALLLVLRIAVHYELSNKIWPLVAFTSFLFGAQLFVSGLLANIILKQKYEVSDKKPYALREEIIRK